MPDWSYPLTPETWRPSDTGVPYVPDARCGACHNPLVLGLEVGYVVREGYILVAHWPCMQADRRTPDDDANERSTTEG